MTKHIQQLKREKITIMSELDTFSKLLSFKIRNYSFANKRSRSFNISITPSPSSLEEI